MGRGKELEQNLENKVFRSRSRLTHNGHQNEDSEEREGTRRKVLWIIKRGESFQRLSVLQRLNKKMIKNAPEI